MTDCSKQCPYDGVIASLRTVLDQVALSLQRIDDKLDEFSRSMTQSSMSVEVLKTSHDYNKEAINRAFEKIEETHEKTVDAHKKIDDLISKGKGVLSTSQVVWTVVTALSGVVGFFIARWH